MRRTRLAVSFGLALAAASVAAVEGHADRGRRRQGTPPAATRPVDADAPSLQALAVAAVSSDPAEAAAARVALRAAGPAGLQALRAAHREALAALETGAAPPSAAREALRAALDTVAGVRDAHASGLYFHTDLDAARTEARARGVPVLSLRLLGRLDEELSCANSRYFRTVLYPDPRVAELLRTRFVLHWSSERPAPRITIDMGDGRTLVRTITGNSVHHVLDADGRVLDALPGLYAPAQFVAALESAASIARACHDARGDEHVACLAREHRRVLGEVARAWESRRVVVSTLPSFSDFASARAPAPAGLPSAVDAMPLTLSKLIVESPVLDAMARRRTQRMVEDFDFLALVQDEVEPLGARTRALVALKTGRADVDALLEALARTATADGVRNEVVFHAELHRWFADAATAPTFDAWNERVYRELFRTPREDPWLGLRAADVWDAVEDVPPR